MIRPSQIHNLRRTRNLLMQSRLSSDMSVQVRGSIKKHLNSIANRPSINKYLP